MTPTWTSDCGRVELWHGDCRDVIPHVKADAVVTDPPYGIADCWKGGGSSGWGKAKAQTQSRNDWDAKAPDRDTLIAICSIGKIQVVWGGNYMDLPISRGWLVWNKPERNFTMSEAELAWTSRDMPMRVFDFKRSDNNRTHPTQKPVAVMAWCMDVAKVPQDAVVFDPYMGSGTTAIACIRTGRRFIGCEIDAGYFEIGKQRIIRELAQPMIPGMEPHKETQGQLI